MDNLQLKKGYKNTEVGVIPVEWEVDKIDNVCSIITGNKNTQDRIDEQNIHFLYVLKLIERINTYSFDGEAVLTAGDGVGTGKIFHYINDKFDFHQRVYKMSHFKENMDGYFFYLYFSNYFYDRIMQMTAKSSVDSVRREMIANMKIPLPPLPEQKAIATVLSDTDNLIQALEKKIAKKQLVKKGAMQKLLTPPSASQIDNGQGTIDNGQGIIDNDKKWEVKRLGDVCDVKKGQLITSSTRIDGNIPVIAGGKKLAYFHKYANRIGKTITISGSGANAGYVSFHDYPIFASDCSTISESNSYSIEYVYFVLLRMQDSIYNMQTGGAQPHIHPRDINPIVIPFPPISEQIEIAQTLSDMDSEIELLQNKLAKYKQLKQGLMQNLLTGKIRLI